VTAAIQTITAQASALITASPAIATPTPTPTVAMEATPTPTETPASLEMVQVTTGAPAAATTAVPAAATTAVPAVATTSAPLQPTSSQPGWIRGNVKFRDSFGNVTVVQEINITLKVGQTRMTAHPDQFGDYRFSNVPAGTAIIEFDYSNYAMQRIKDIPVLPGQEVNVGQFFVKPIVPHEFPTPCSFVRPCTFPTQVNAPPQ
jgi:hypothetical protein